MSGKAGALTNAGALGYYNHGSVAASRDAVLAAADAVADAETIRIETPPEKHSHVKENLRRLEKVKAVAAVRVPGISFFAVAGTLVVSFLMVLVVLAQINYNEAAGESARVEIQLRELAEKHRALELAFESSIDIKEVERFARDELGMSRPDAAQIIIINTVPRDSATVISAAEERGTQGFGEFIKSLTDYFKK